MKIKKWKRNKDNGVPQQDRAILGQRGKTLGQHEPTSGNTRGGGVEETGAVCTSSQY